MATKVHGVKATKNLWLTQEKACLLGTGPPAEPLQGRARAASQMETTVDWQDLPDTGLLNDNWERGQKDG